MAAVEQGFSSTAIKQDLEEKGYTVVPNVLTNEECYDYRKVYEKWGKGYKSAWPTASIISKYGLGYATPAWSVRLKAKPVFSAIWGTDKLLSSMDAVAIGKPPEEGDTLFRGSSFPRYHFDQVQNRIGLHAYQGAVYLEEACEDDWCMLLVEGSHKFHGEYFKSSGDSRKNYSNIKEEDLNWFKKKGCTAKTVGCPKGGMILWDSQLVHSGLPPMKGRANPGRWRYVVFVCMGPAQWASANDIAVKVNAFYNLRSTGHWPDQKPELFSTDKGNKDQQIVHTLPDICKTSEVLQLVGAELYDFEDGRPNGPSWTPKLTDETFGS